jgi:hypothetical protein
MRVFILVAIMASGCAGFFETVNRMEKEDAGKGFRDASAVTKGPVYCERAVRDRLCLREVESERRRWPVLPPGHARSARDEVALRRAQGAPDRRLQELHLLRHLSHGKALVLVHVPRTGPSVPSASTRRQQCQTPDLASSTRES